MAKISNQTGRILDAISAGPIEGLVKGNESVFLDDTAILRGAVVDVSEAPTDTINTVANTTQNSTTITVPHTQELANLIGNLSSALPRFIWVEGAGRRASVASYGGVGGAKKDRIEDGLVGVGEFHTGGGSGKAILTYPFTANLDKDDDPNFGTRFNDPDFQLFSREIIDLHKYYSDGTVEKQTNKSQVKQTFTINQNSHRTPRQPTKGSSSRYNYNVGGSVERKHFFKDISTRGFDVAGTGPADRNELVWQYSYRGANIYSDVIAQENLIDITNAEDVGRCGILGNTGSNPHFSSKAGGSYETDYLIFDGVYSIVDVSLNNNRSLIDIEIDASTGTSSSDYEPRAPYRSLANARAHIFTTEGVGATDTTVFRGDVQFRKGEVDQEELTAKDGVSPPRTNVIINPNTTLLWSNNFSGTNPDDGVAYSGTSAPTIYTSSGSSASSLGLSALQTRQIDAIRLNIIFPNGLFAIQKNGDYIDGIFDATIKFRHRNSLSLPFTESALPIRGENKGATYWHASSSIGDFSGPLGTTPGMLVKENKKAQFSREVTIDIAQFQPFIDFEIEIERQTPDKFDDYMIGSRIEDDDEEKEVKQFSGTAVVQYVQALFYDKFTYPLTAYAAVTFSGADFDKIPTRGYHCRGLKIRVPSNYITREEDALLSGTTGIARYSRTPLGYDKTEKTQNISNSTVLRNQISFTLTAGELDIGRLTSDIGYWTGKEDASSALPAADISPNLDNLIVSFYNTDPDGDGTLTHTGSINIRFNTNYKLYGSNIELYKEVVSATVVDPVTGDTLTYDTVDAFFDENTSRPGVQLSQSNYSASTPGITAGKTYSVTINFNNNVIRPNNYVVWDGSFRNEVYCNNPAWIFFDLLTHPEYGLGDFLTEEDIDIYELYEIARYCDELVPDGKGGLEPRFTCNVYINKSTEAYQLVKDLASTFRGMSVYQNSKIIPIQDRPKSSVYLFTQGNVIDGVFKYSRQSVRAKPNSIECTWNDPEQQFRQDVLVLDDTEAQLKIGRVISKKIVAFGCTSKGQAKRVAEWHLATNQKETKRITFSTSINAALLQVGDVISVQDHQTNARVQMSGRIKNAPARDILTLDREVTLDFDNHSYVIFVQVVDSVFICRQRTATINGVTYNLGDIIRETVDGVLLTGSTYNSDEIVDDNNESVKTEKTKRTSVVQKELLPSQTHTSNTVFLSSEIEFLYYKDMVDAGANAEDFDGLDREATIQALLNENIWAIAKNDVNDNTIEKYRIMGIKPEADGFNTSISGILYDESKFSKADVNNSSFSDPFYNDTLANTLIAAPVNGHAELVATLTVT